MTYAMEQSPWFSASQEIHRILQNPNVHYHIHNYPPPVPVLSQTVSFIDSSHESLDTSALSVTTWNFRTCGMGSAPLERHWSRHLVQNTLKFYLHF